MPRDRYELLHFLSSSYSLTLRSRPCNTAFLPTYPRSFYIRSFLTTSTSQHFYLYYPRLNNETHYAPLHQRINTNQTLNQHESRHARQIPPRSSLCPRRQGRECHFPNRGTELGDQWRTDRLMGRGLDRPYQFLGRARQRRELPRRDGILP